MAGLFLLVPILNESNVTSFQAWNEVAYYGQRYEFGRPLLRLL